MWRGVIGVFRDRGLDGCTHEEIDPQKPAGGIG